MSMDYRYLIWTEEKVKRFWDYESQFPEHYFTYQVGANLARLIKRYTHENDLLLDFGSGPGFLADHLLQCNLRVSALEFSPDSLKKIKDKFGKRKGFEGAYTTDELIGKNIRFDFITLTEVIEHLDDTFLNKTFEDIVRLLKPGGHLFITTPNNENLDKSMVCCPETNELFHRWQHVRSWNKESLEAFLVKKGFRVGKIGATDFNFNSFSSAIRYPYQSLRFYGKRLIGRDNFPHLYCLCALKGNQENN
jgi:2-polyprenyl-3-methyl-5-hydroxy-6-metoxy-1,4-benzoquinol methylase